METSKPELPGRRTGVGLVMAAVGAVTVAAVAIVTMVTRSNDSSADGVPYPEVRRIAATEAHALVQSGDALIVDVRERSEYLAEHVAGSRGIPEGELADRLDEIPRDRLIITYCA